MSWLMTDDGFGDHPKTQATSLADLGRLWLLRVWCAKHLTDGAFSVQTAKDVGRFSRSDDAHAFLTRCSFLGWVDAPEDLTGQWRIHDFLDYNQSAESVHAKRDANAKRQRRHYHKHKPPNAVREGVRQEAPNATPYLTPPPTGVGVVTERVRTDPPRPPLEGGPGGPADNGRPPAEPVSEPRPDPPPPRREEPAYDDPPLWRDCPACGARACRPCLGEVLCPERRPAAHRAPDWQALAAQSPVMAEALRRRKLIGGPEP